MNKYLLSYFRMRMALIREFPKIAIQEFMMQVINSESNTQILLKEHKIRQDNLRETICDKTCKIEACII